MMNKILSLAALVESTSALMVGVSSPRRVSAIAMQQVEGISDETLLADNSLAEMYKARWANEKADAAPRANVLPINTELPSDDKDEACLIYTGDEVCGEMSFDSTDDMVRAGAKMTPVPTPQI